jgi:uncharacterized glyoxalase superfamily protein PhnB
MPSLAKKISHIPNGFTAVTPYFQVANGEMFLKFLQEAFDAQVVDLQMNDGVMGNFAVKVFDAMVEGSNITGEGRRTSELTIHLYVSDTDATYAKALAAGGTSIYEVADMPYGERSGGIKDPCGNSWYIATQQIDMYPEQAKADS